MIVVAGLALLGVGCVGDTDQATNVGAHSAQLNGHGKANNGPAFSYFEYWKAGDPPASKLKTPTRNWPAGAEGPISERPQHLSESTAYSYRLCGADQGKSPICTSTKQFTTGVAWSHLRAANGGEEFSNEPGVNSDVILATGSGGVPVLIDSICGAGGNHCGSRIDATGSSCVSGSEIFVTCPIGVRMELKLGDLDDRVSGGWPAGRSR